MDEERGMEEFNEWSGKVKHSMKDAKSMFENGRREITRINDEKARLTKEKIRPIA